MDNQQTVPSPAPQPKKKGNSLLWIILLGGCGCFLLVTCACVGFFALIFTSEEFKTSYCDSLEEQGMDLSEDPLGICN